MSKPADATQELPVPISRQVITKADIMRVQVTVEGLDAADGTLLSTTLNVDLNNFTKDQLTSFINAASAEWQK